MAALPDSLPVKSDSTPTLIGRSAALRLVQQEVEYAARSDAKVLITGASGVGKEVVAHLIHARSRRRHAQQFEEQEAKTREVLAALGCKYAHFGTEESPEVTQEKLITVLKSTRSQPVLV